MYYEKVIEVTIDVSNPINFCADIKRHLLSEIRATYVNCCFKGAFILNVKSILDFSPCCIMRTNNSGKGYIDVKFVADVVVVSKWDIIIGAEVVSKQQMMLCNYKDQGTTAQAIITLLPSKALETLSIGQIIPVRIIMTSHGPMQQHISAAGMILTCDQDVLIYRLQGVLDQSAAIELTPMFEKVKIELERRATLRKEDIWFFERLLYSYRSTDTETEEILAWENGPTWTGPIRLKNSNEMVSALDIIRRAISGESVPVDGLWSRTLNIYRSHRSLLL